MLNHLKGLVLLVLSEELFNGTGARHESVKNSAIIAHCGFGSGFFHLRSSAIPDVRSIKIEAGSH